MKNLGLSSLSVVAVLSSCSPASDIHAECPVSQVWQGSFEHYRDSDVFIDVTVKKNSYEVFGLSFKNDEDFSRFLKVKNTLMTSTYSNPVQLLARSDKSVTCERFQKATTVIESNYPCETGDLCFSAYRRGENFLPPNIAPPPSIKAPDIAKDDKSN